MELEEALEHALDGNAILFVGAGFSVGAKNLRGESIKPGRELAVSLSRAVGLPDQTPLDDASEAYQKKHGEDRLIAELQQEYTASSIGDHHLIIARIPWRRIYTTNYDNVLETARSRLMRRLTPVTATDDIRKIPKENLSIHLNGYIDRLNRETLGSEFKLTDSSYVSSSLLDSPWLVLFRQDLKLARSVFFIGYSLSDLDIKRILFDTPDLLNKTFFILGDVADTVTANRASRFGTCVPFDTVAFAVEISRKAAIYAPRERMEQIGNSIQRYSLPSELPAFSDRFVFDLLLHGSVKPEFVWSGLHNGPRYFLDRPGITKVLDQLDHAPLPVFLYSDLGNGKTLLIEGIKCRAAERGYDVYTVTARTDDLFAELDTVLHCENKVLAIIDDYPSWLDVIEYIGVHSKPELRLLLSARSSVHDVMIDRVCELLRCSEAIELPLDHLSTLDIDWLAHLLEEYGLWGDKAAWPQDRKLSYLKDRCHGQFHAVLLSVLESPQILSRLSRVFEDLEEKRGYYDIVLSILVLAVLQHPTSIDTLIDMWGERVLEANFRQNAAVRQLMDMSNGRVELRSAVAAMFILQRVADAGVIIDTLTQMARVAERAAVGSPFYWELLRSLTRFSNLQILLPERQRRTSVLRYYENVKNLSICARNPHFWLQYAIACMVIEELGRADRYFATAYSLAKAREGYNTYMLDNHFARFSLVKAIHDDDENTCMAAFRKTRNIINDQIKRERLHYPYRVASTYANFYDTFESRLSADHRNEIYRAAKYILDKIKELPDYRQQQRYVSECADAMQYIVESVEAKPAC